MNNHYAEHSLEVAARVFLELLEKVDANSLQRAKNLTHINVNLTLERSNTRLEDNLRNLLN